MTRGQHGAKIVDLARHGNFIHLRLGCLVDIFGCVAMGKIRWIESRESNWTSTGNQLGIQHWIWIVGWTITSMVFYQHHNPDFGLDVFTINSRSSHNTNSTGRCGGFLRFTDVTSWGYVAVLHQQGDEEQAPSHLLSHRWLSTLGGIHSVNVSCNVSCLLYMEKIGEGYFSYSWMVRSDTLKDAFVFGRQMGSLCVFHYFAGPFLRGIDQISTD